MSSLRLPETPVGCHKPREHGRDQSGRLYCLTGFARQCISVSNQLSMYLGRQFRRDLDRLVVRNRSNFEFGHVLSSSVWFENEISIDDHAYRKSRTDGQRRLNIETATHNLLAGLIQGVAGPVPQGLNDRTVIAIRI